MGGDDVVHSSPCRVPVTKIGRVKRPVRWQVINGRAGYDRHGGTGLSESLGDSPPHPTGAARDEHDPTGKINGDGHGATLVPRPGRLTGI